MQKDFYQTLFLISLYFKSRKTKHHNGNKTFKVSLNTFCLYQENCSVTLIHASCAFLLPLGVQLLYHICSTSLIFSDFLCTFSKHVILQWRVMMMLSDDLNGEETHISTINSDQKYTTEELRT